MSREYDVGLLRDLARLVAKHGPEECEKLAAALRSPELVETLASLLEAGAAAGRRSGTRPQKPPQRKKKQARSPAEILRVVRESRPEVTSDLETLSGLLQSRLTAALREDLNAVLVGHGMPEISGRSASIRTSRCLEALLVKSDDEIRLVVAALAEQATEGSDLDGWAGIILGDRPSHGR